MQSRNPLQERILQRKRYCEKYDKGFFMAAVAKTLVGNCDAGDCKLLALRKWVLLARNVCIKVHFAEVDASNVVSAVTGNSHNFRETNWVIDDIKGQFQEVKTIYRLSNVMAHNLTALALSSREDLLDILIQNRSVMDFDYADYMLTVGRKGKENTNVVCTPWSVAYSKGLAEALNMNRFRNLAFKNKAATMSFEKTLDAHDIQDNFYLDLLGWGCSNVLAIALDNKIVSWALDGQHIAVGLNNSHVQIWDSTVIQKLRTLICGHRSRIDSLAWNENILTTRGMDGKIINNDVRVREHIVQTYRGHQQDGNLLASGGGGGDKCIKFWNTHTGACLNSVDTSSQFCALLWSIHDRELLSSHGFTENKLTLWKYSSMVKMAELTGHTYRVLFMAHELGSCLDRADELISKSRVSIDVDDCVAKNVSKSETMKLVLVFQGEWRLQRLETIFEGLSVQVDMGMVQLCIEFDALRVVNLCNEICFSNGDVDKYHS
ncbi:hypothetical protein Dsin_006955 [Dipteronia sinensis]|uniref:Uncharacterized protein n=1 Tax=Dipteronia sinensis TaxID=43782 RepID=A0AAE0EG20_9ROSI|nr:hypothetical protein Dsin_006955 [Dipteronia sinensis]